MRHWGRSSARSLSRLFSLGVHPRPSPHASSSPLDPTLLFLHTPTAPGNVIPFPGISATRLIGAADVSTSATSTTSTGSGSSAPPRLLTCEGPTVHSSGSAKISTRNSAAGSRTSATSTPIWRCHVHSYSASSSSAALADDVLQKDVLHPPGRAETGRVERGDGSTTTARDAGKVVTETDGASGARLKKRRAKKKAESEAEGARVESRHGESGAEEEAPGAAVAWDEVGSTDIARRNASALREILGATNDCVERVFRANERLLQVPMRRTIRSKAREFALLSLPLATLRRVCETGPYLHPGSLSPVTLLEELLKSLPQDAAWKMMEIGAPGIFHMNLPLVRRRLARFKALGFADPARALLEAPHLLVGGHRGFRKASLGVENLESFLDGLARVVADEMGYIPPPGTPVSGPMHSSTTRGPSPGTGSGAGPFAEAGKGRAGGNGTDAGTGAGGQVGAGAEGRSALEYLGLRRAVAKLVESKPNLLGTRAETVRKVLRILKSLFGLHGATQLVLRQPNLLTGKAETIAASVMLLMRHFGEDGALHMLRVQPTLMLLRDTKLQLKIDLLTQQGSWSLDDLAADPTVLAVGVQRLQDRIVRIQSAIPSGLCHTSILRSREPLFQRYLKCANEGKPWRGRAIN